MTDSATTSTVWKSTWPAALMGSAGGSRPTRAGSQPDRDDLVDVSQEGGPALRAELEALERELRQSK